MPLIRNADIKPYDLMGNRMRGLSTPSRGAQEIAVWHGKMIEHGAVTPPHTHDHEEVVVVLAGPGSAALDGTRVDVAPGDVLIVPSFLPHQLFGGDGATLECMAVMPIGTRTFLPNGEELHAPWAE
jgi:uncharacterized RmlC-like cupin family protein